MDTVRKIMWIARMQANLEEAKKFRDDPSVPSESRYHHATLADEIEGLLDVLSKEGQG